MRPGGEAIHGIEIKAVLGRIQGPESNSVCAVCCRALDGPEHGIYFCGTVKKIAAPRSYHADDPRAVDKNIAGKSDALSCRGGPVYVHGCTDFNAVSPAHICGC